MGVDAGCGDDMSALGCPRPCRSKFYCERRSREGACGGLLMMMRRPLWYLLDVLDAF